MLDELLRFVEAGGRLPGEPWHQVIASPDTQVILAFPGHIVIATHLSEAVINYYLAEDDDDLSAPLNPPFLSRLERRTRMRVNNIDMLMLASRLDGPVALELEELTDLDHPRVIRARRYRYPVAIYRTEGGVLVVGKGVGGRWEVAVEVEPAAQGKGLGRALAVAARHLVPEDRPIWAQIAPGNATSVRAFLAAGYVPVGAEALFVR